MSEHDVWIFVYWCYRLYIHSAVAFIYLIFQWDIRRIQGDETPIGLHGEGEKWNLPDGEPQEWPAESSIQGMAP